MAATGRGCTDDRSEPGTGSSTGGGHEDGADAHGVAGGDAGPETPADDGGPAVAGAESVLGTGRVVRHFPDTSASENASRLWWDADAEDYHRTHGGFLGAEKPDGDFVWCPEGLREADAELLGPADALAGMRILEVGCGSAPCARWLASRGASVVGFDVSIAMLRQGIHAGRVTLVQAGAERMPFQDSSFDAACSSFGAVPFAADSALLMREAARVLRPGGRWVFSVNHPIRWMFPDDPGPAGLTVSGPYFDRSPYVEIDAAGREIYVEHHRTIGDRVREIVGAGLVLEDIIEPEWPDGLRREWGQWSPLRGRLFPGTAIYCCRKPR